MEAFDKESLPGKAFEVASGSGGGVAEKDPLKSKNFSIISQKEDISLSCLAWIEATAVATAYATALIIDYWREESMIWELALIFLKWKTVAGNLSTSVSQQES